MQGHWSSGAGPTVVDARLGAQTGQVFAPGFNEQRRPVGNLTFRFFSSAAGENITHNIPTLTGVTRLELIKVNISGITGSHNNLILDFSNGSQGALKPYGRLIGVPAARPHCVAVECNGAANVTISQGEPLMVESFKEPRTLDHISFDLKNSTGATVLYNECIMWFSLELQSWQTN
jgi:hypothetical protein